MKTKEYPEEFIGRHDKKYKLVKVYKHYAMYESEAGYKICFDLDGIKREQLMKRKG